MAQQRHESILRAINGSSQINILTGPTHEAYQTNLESLDGITFWMGFVPGVFKPWTHSSRPVPKNHVLLADMNLPVDVKIDIVLSQNKFGQFQHLKPIADRYNAPLISLEHTWPHPSWGQRELQQTQMMRGDLNVFISDQSRQAWGFQADDPTVRILRHGINTDVFAPNESVRRDPFVLTVANDYINRDWCLGYSIYDRVTKDLPKLNVGETPGLSKAAANRDELIHRYRSAGVFLNTSTFSPIPMSLLEAASVGCPIVTNDTCACGDLIEDGVNGFITRNEQIMRDRLIWCLDHPEEAQEMGRNARKTVLEKFSLGSHLSAWKELIREAYGKVHNQWKA